MWPWEHLAFAYLSTSSIGHARWRCTPSAAVTAVVAFASQLPDLIDKPLAWEIGILPSGRSLAHSLFVAVPLSTVALIVAARSNRRDARYAAMAFTVAYSSHLLGDILYSLAVTGQLDANFLLWPLVPTDSGSNASLAVPEHVEHLAVSFGRFLSTPRGQLYLIAEVILLFTGLLRWVLDDVPGAASCRALVAHAVDRAQ